MEIGTEISQKIRSAIKAKLIELGAYVDDELPDYIMVMVANKRSQKQMTDDLSLFLSTNTEKFTTWLHGLLKKLQSINTDQVQGQSKPKHKEKHKSEKKKRKASGSSEKPTKTEPEKSSTDGKKEETKKQKVEDREGDGKVAERITSTVKTGDDEPATEISISENTDEFNEENKEVEKTEPSKTGKAAQGKKSAGEGKKSAAKSQGKTEKEGKKSSKKKPTSIVASVKRKYEVEEEEEEYDPLNPAVGNVASVIRGPTRKSSIPKSMQANRSLLMKAVTDAEKSISTSKKLDSAHTGTSAPGMKSDQSPVDVRKRLKTAAGLQLISRTKRKGIEDMTYTIKNDVKKPRKSSEGLANMKYTVKNVQVVKPAGQKKSKAPAVVPSRVAASALKGISQNAEVVKEDEEEGEVEEENAEEYGPPLPDTRLVHKAVKEGTDTNEDSNGYTESNDSGPDPEIQKILDEAQDTDLDLNLDSPIVFQYADNKRIIKKEKRSPSPKDPRFIVTLDGVDPTTFIDTVVTQEKPNVVQTVKPMARFPANVPQAVPEVVEDQTKQSPPPEPAEFYPPKIKPFNINLKESDDEEEEAEEETSTEATTPVPSILERCRFWPACANGSACQYIHPSIPCKTFPYCKFGEKCMYIHPNCKYDAKCTRMDCPFTHASKRSTVHPTVIHKIVQVPIQPFIPARPPPQHIYPSSGYPASSGYTASNGGQANVCKFYPNCRNMNCTFVHPKPCRYGIGCMNKNSCTFYHPALPTKDKLKWTPPGKKIAEPPTNPAAQKTSPTTT